MGIKRNIKKVYYLLLDLTYKLGKRFFWNKIRDDIVNSSSIRIVDTTITINVIEDSIINKKKGAYLRFGDGDVFLMMHKEDAYQEINENLAYEMREAFNCSGKNVHKCLAIHSNSYGFEQGMSLGNHLNSDKLAQNLLKNTFEFFIGERIYSPVALHFKASNDIERAKSFLITLKNNVKIFVGNKNIRQEIILKLFGEITHVKTPEKNAYNEIEKIYNETKNGLEKIDSFCVVVVAMGCSGRPLMKRLLKDKYNVYLFDFGSLLDGINGTNTRTWLKVNNIDYQYLLKDL